MILSILSQKKYTKMNKNRVVTYADLVRDLSALGVQSGDILNVKVSLSSIGMIDGGAQTLINALVNCVGNEGTVITDSFVTCYPLPLSKANATVIIDSKSPSYAGALANAMIMDERSIRSDHPIQKFAAIGKYAHELMHRHTPNSYAYDVLRNLIDIGGKNLKIGSDEKVYGFGTTHVAIGSLNQRQRRRRMGVMYKDKSGQNKLFELNWSSIGCGVNKFIPKYQEAGAIISQGYVGYAPAKITDMKITYDVEIETLKKNPAYHLCESPLCASCRLSWEFSDNTFFQYIQNNGHRLSLSLIVEAMRIQTVYKYPF